MNGQGSRAAHVLWSKGGGWLGGLILRIAGVALLLALPSVAGAGTERLGAAEDAKVVFVDVGQGDGVIIKVGGRIIVSDAGLPNAADEMNAALERLGADHHIYRAILSHAHADHVGGFIGLLEDYGYTIDAAVYAPHPHYMKTETNRELMDALSNRGVPLIAVKKGDKFFWGGASWTILNPPAGAFQGEGGEANDSIAYRLRTKGSDLLFTGDIEREALPGLIDSWTFGRAEVFLATHHGSNYGSTTELLDKIHPEFSVLSTGRNPYGHPGIYAIARLESSGTTIFCTEQNGTLTLTLASGGALDWRASRQEQPWWTPTDGETGKCVDR